MSNIEPIENYVIRQLDDSNLLVWPSKAQSGCSIEEVKVKATIRSGKIFVVLTNATGFLLRCHSQALNAEISVTKVSGPKLSGKEDSYSLLTVEFEGDHQTRSLNPYKELLIKEVADIIHRTFYHDLAKEIVANLSDSDLEIQGTMLSVKTYNHPDSIANTCEMFEIYVAHKPNGKEARYLFAKYFLNVELTDNYISVLLSGERVSKKNGQIGATIFGEVDKYIISKVALGLAKSKFIPEENMAGTTTYTNENGIPAIKVVFNRQLIKTQ